MKEIRINLLEVGSLDHGSSQSFKEPVHVPKKTIAALTLIALLLAATGIYSYRSTNNEDSRLSKTLQIFNSLGHFALNADKRVKGEKEDRINILLLGIGGEGHEGGQLTDTIVVMSIKPSTHRAALISVPRDLLVNIPGYGLRKINNANAFGEQDEHGKGPDLTREVIGDALKLPIHYYVRVDFQAFEEIVDTLGGLSVMVDNSFTDYQYPTKDKKYQVISFEAGPQIMNGERAIKFGRSRHSGMNNEGSDFARSKRQQKLLVAFKEKILSAELLLKPQKISDIINALQTHIVTDFQSWEMVKLATLAKDIDQRTITNVVLDDGLNGFLYPENVEGAYVLRPRGGSFDAIAEKVAGVFNNPQGASDATIAPRKARVIVKNGTTAAGLAGRTAETLKGRGFTILSFGNASKQDREKTAIYDLTKGALSIPRSNLDDLFHAEIIDGDTDEESDPYKVYADFLVIIGKDFTSTPPTP